MTKANQKACGKIRVDKNARPALHPINRVGIVGNKQQSTQKRDATIRQGLKAVRT